AAGYGVQFVTGSAASAERWESWFRVRCEPEESLPADYDGRTLLLATGVADRFPQFPGLRECLGLTVFICPDCDGYETAGKRTIVMGSGNSGAGMALALTYFSNDLVYVNHELASVGERLAAKLQEAGVQVLDARLERILTAGDAAEGRFAGVALADG